jgi:hypothetical protein
MYIHENMKICSFLFFYSNHFGVEKKVRIPYSHMYILYIECTHIYIHTGFCVSILIFSGGKENTYNAFTHIHLNLYIINTKMGIWKYTYLYLYRFLCFYSNLFGVEKKIRIPYSHITSITKENTALVIPNAIAIATSKCLFICKWICVYVYICLHVCICLYIYIYIYVICIYIYICIYINIYLSAIYILIYVNYSYA